MSIWFFLIEMAIIMDYPTIEDKSGKQLPTKALSVCGDCCDFHAVKGGQ